MVDNNDNEELQASRRQRGQLKKYGKLARTSMLAITMGMNWHAVQAAADGSMDAPSPNQQVSAVSPTPYNGNSLAYFKNEFLPRSSYRMLIEGESAPTAANVHINGTAKVGQILTGDYRYEDAQSNEEQGTTYQWYRSDDAGQTVNYMPIADATDLNYTLTPDDLGKYITFVVTPRTNVVPREGDPTKSDATSAVGPAPTAPIAANVTIGGTATVGQTLTGAYAFADPDNDPESGSTYQWYRSDDAEQSVNYAPIDGAAGSSYTLTAADQGKYITFVVTPRTSAAPTDGLPATSAAAGPIAAVPYYPPVNVTEPPAPREEESLIEVVAVQQNMETRDSAKLTLTKDDDGIALASFHFLSDGVVQSSEDANRKDTIAVRASTLTGAKKVYADIAGDAIAKLQSNQQRLAVLTGDVAIEFPTWSIPLDELAGNSGIPADRLKIEITIEKQSETVREQGNEWAALHGASVIGDPFKFGLQVNDGTNVTPVVQYGNNYAYQTVPIPAGVTNLNALGAVMLLDGKYVPVPVRIVDDGHALIHTPTNATVMLIQRNEQYRDLDTHWGKNDLLLMADKGNIGEDGDDRYNPDNVLTRGEFAELLVKALGLGHQLAGQDPVFADLPSDPAARESIVIAAKDGLFNGVAEDRFAPDQAVTREQIVAVLMRFYREFELETNSPANGSAPPFGDTDPVSDWAAADVQAAGEAGIIAGYENGTSRMTNPGTRAEAAALIRRFLQTTSLTN